jgi:chloride channel 7
VSWEQLENMYPRFPPPDSIELSASDLSCWIDLRPYMNRTMHLVNATSPVMRAFGLFRTLGVRYLVVVDDYNDVVGVITRSELTHDALRRRFIEVRRLSSEPTEPLLFSSYGAVDTTGTPFEELRRNTSGVHVV